MTDWIVLLAAEAAETTSEEGGLFDFDATLPLMALQFVILVAVLNVTFYKPLSQAIDGRADYLRQAQAEARERQEKSRNLAKQYDEELQEARRQSQEIISAAQAEAQQQASERTAQAQREVQAQREEADQQIKSQQAEALQSLEQQVDTLSSQILEKLLGRDLIK